MRPVRQLLELHAITSDLENLLVDTIGATDCSAAYAEKLRIAQAAIVEARKQLIRDRLDAKPTNTIEVALHDLDEKVVIDVPLEVAP